MNCKSQQKASYWISSERNKSIMALHRNSQKDNFTKNAKLFELDLGAFRETIFLAIASHKQVQIVMPNVEGKFEIFSVTENSGFSPELQAQFPEIRSFSGKGITDKYASINLSYSPNGIQVMIMRADKESEFIEAYFEDKKIYVVFNKSDKNPNWNCTTPIK